MKDTNKCPPKKARHISPPDPMVDSWRDSPFWGDDFIIHNRRDQDFSPYIHKPTHQSSQLFAGHMTTGWTSKNQRAPIVYKNKRRIPLLLMVLQHLEMGTHGTCQAYTVYLHAQHACPWGIWHYTKAFLPFVVIKHLSKKPCNLLRYVLCKLILSRFFVQKAWGKCFIANVNLTLFTLKRLRGYQHCRYSLVFGKPFLF